MPLPDRGWSMSVKLETVSRIIGGVADSTDSVLGYLHRSPNILSWSLYPGHGNHFRPGRPDSTREATSDIPVF